jgi:hypothetical protein
VKLPADGVISNALNKTGPRATAGTGKYYAELLRGVLAQLLGGSPEEVLLLDAANSVKPTRSEFAVDTTAASDELDRIFGEDAEGAAGLPDGSFVLVRPASALRVITARHLQGGAYQLDLLGGVNFVMNDPKKGMFLHRRGTTWVEVVRLFGGDAAAERDFIGLTSAAIVTNPIPGTDDGKAIVAGTGVDAGRYVKGAATAPGGPAERLLVRTTTNAVLGAANGVTFFQVPYAAVEVETDAGALFDTLTDEVKVPAGISAIRVAFNASVDFSTPPASSWYAEAYLFHKVAGGAYPGSPDAATAKGLGSATIQGRTDAKPGGELNFSSGMIPVATGDRLKVMMIAGGGPTNVRVRGASRPAYCWLDVEFFE